MCIISVGLKMAELLSYFHHRCLICLLYFTDIFAKNFCQCTYFDKYIKRWRAKSLNISFPNNLITDSHICSKLLKVQAKFKCKLVRPLTTSGLYCKHIFMIVSDACTISVSLVFALALASVINYDCKWCSKLWRHLWSSFWWSY